MPTSWKNFEVNSFPPETEDRTSLTDTCASLWGVKEDYLSCSQIPDPQKLLWDNKHVYYHKVCNNFITQLQKISTVHFCLPYFISSFFLGIIHPASVQYPHGYPSAQHLPYSYHSQCHLTIGFLNSTFVFPTPQPPPLATTNLFFVTIRVLSFFCLFKFLSYMI